MMTDDELTTWACDGGAEVYHEGPFGYAGPYWQGGGLWMFVGINGLRLITNTEADAVLACMGYVEEGGE